MEKLVPEFESSFAQIPMARSRWMSPTEDYEVKDGNTIPCYIPTDRNDMKEIVPKKDYIWMPKWNDNTPAGYYHLSTQEAHGRIYRLFQERRQRRNIFKKKTPEMKLESQIYDVLENRLLSDQPNDEYATRMRYFFTSSQGAKAKSFGRATFLPVLSALAIKS